MMLQVKQSGLGLFQRFLRLPQSIALHVITPGAIGFVSKKAVLQRSIQIHNILLGKIENERGRLIVIPGDKIIPIPTCLLQIHSPTLLNDNQISGKFFMDIINYSALVTINKVSAFWDSNLYESGTAQDSWKVTPEGEKSASTRLKFLIECASKFSDSIFFVEFPQPLAFKRTIIGYYQRSGLKFMALNLGKIQLFDTVDELVHAVFGSKLKLNEMLSRKMQSVNIVPCAKCEVRRTAIGDRLAFKIPTAECPETNSSLLIAYINKTAGITAS